MTLNALFAQLKVISLLDGSSYQPLKDVTIGGIVMVRHAKPGSDEQLVEPVAGILISYYLFFLYYKFTILLPETFNDSYRLTHGVCNWYL